MDINTLNPGPSVYTTNTRGTTGGSSVNEGGIRTVKRGRSGAGGDGVTFVTPGSTQGELAGITGGYETVGRLLVVVGDANPVSTTIDGATDINAKSQFENNTSTTNYTTNDSTNFTQLGWASTTGVLCAAWARVMKSQNMDDNKVVFFPNSVGTAGRSSAFAYLYEPPSNLSFGSDHKGVDVLGYKKIESYNQNVGTYANTSCKFSAGELFFDPSKYYIAVTGTRQSGNPPSGTNYHYFSNSDPASEVHAKATSFWKTSPNAIFRISLTGASYSNWAEDKSAEFRIVIGPGHLFAGQEIGANGFHSYSIAATRSLTYFVSVGRLLLS